jgi:hypothetical protein
VKFAMRATFGVVGFCIAGLVAGLWPQPIGAQQPTPKEAQTVVSSRGPLRIMERNPLYHLFLTPMVLGADLTADGQTSATWGAAYSNIFEYNWSPQVRQRFDTERLAATLTVRHGVREGIEVGIQLGFQYNWVGFLDPFIQGLHKTFGLPNDSREFLPNNLYAFLLEGPDNSGVVYVDRPGGLAPEMPRILGAWQISGGPDSNHALAARATWKLPGGDTRTTTGRSDAALELVARRSWGPHHLHLVGGAVTLNAPPEIAPVMRPMAALATVGFERTVSERLSLVAQFTGSTPYTRPTGFRALNRGAINLVFGAQGEVRGWEWQASFAEDYPPNTASVDFTLDVQFARMR